MAAFHRWRRSIRRWWRFQFEGFRSSICQYLGIFGVYFYSENLGFFGFFLHSVLYVCFESGALGSLAKLSSDDFLSLGCMFVFNPAVVHIFNGFTDFESSVPIYLPFCSNAFLIQSFD